MKLNGGDQIIISEIPELIPESILIEEKSQSLLIKLIERNKGEYRNGYEYAYPHILFLLNGVIQITDRKSTVMSLKSGQCVFLPKNEPVDILALESARFVLLMFSRQTFLMRKDEFSTYKVGHIEFCTHPILDLTPLIANFLDNLPYVKDVLNSPNFQRIKAEELYEIARYCYSSRQLAWFFQSVIRPKDDLEAFIVANYRKVKSVYELALLAGMCETTFRIRFQEIFGENVHTWLMKKKAIQMECLVEQGEDTIKSLMKILEFKHKSSFICFCNRWLGGNPSEVIRRLQQNKYIYHNSEQTLDMRP